MSRVKVVGAELREGDFNGNHYKNYLFHVVPEQSNENVIFGVCPTSVKVKAKWAEDNDISIKSLNQQTVEFFYDSYGNVAKIDVVKR